MLFRWLLGKKEVISQKTIEHSTKGEFNTKGRFISGGHSQRNINELERLDIDYNIVKTYTNGVRVGNVPNHGTKKKRSGINQSWFPRRWNNEKIKRAGQNIARGKVNKDGIIKSGYYSGVLVGIIRTNGKISAIFPVSPQTNKKGEKVHERRKTKRIGKRKR